MGLSHGALNELRRELGHLRQARADIEARLQGIELILSAEPDTRTGSPGAVSARHSDATNHAVPQQGPHKQISLRKKVLEILRRAPGSKSSDVAQMIQADGFRIGGVTSLRNRVSHEISQLRKHGLVRRDRSGLYVVSAKVPGSASEGAENRSVAS